MRENPETNIAYIGTLRRFELFPVSYLVTVPDKG